MLMVISLGMFTFSRHSCLHFFPLMPKAMLSEGVQDVHLLYLQIPSSF